MIDAVLIYLTCANAHEAQKIVSTLLDQRLIAGGNIMPPHQAFYHWQGKVQNAEENAVILKTRAALFDRVRQVVISLHSYECPCLVALPIQNGYPPFLEWIVTETTKT